MCLISDLTVEFMNERKYLYHRFSYKWFVVSHSFLGESLFKSAVKVADLMINVLM